MNRSTVRALVRAVRFESAAAGGQPFPAASKSGPVARRIYPLPTCISHPRENAAVASRLRPGVLS